LNLTAIVVIAGQVGRAEAGQPDLLRPLAGWPAVRFVLDAVRALEPIHLVLVGPGAEQVRKAAGAEVTAIPQGGRSDWAQALRLAKQAVAGQAATVLVLGSNTPLLRAATLEHVAARHQAEGAAITLLTSEPGDGGQVTLTEAPSTGGVYCFRDGWLWPSVDGLVRQSRVEFTTSDLVALAWQQGETVLPVPVADPLELMEVDDGLKAARAEAELRGRINEHWLLAGVALIHPEATYIEAGVEIGTDTVVWPNTFLQGETRIGRKCTIGPGSVIRDSIVGDGCRVELSVVEQAIMEEGSNVGPFGHLRKGAHLGPAVHMGNFGEVKNSYLGPGVKMGHFSYLGDATVGEGSNIGAGTITCNYDGQRKQRTIVGKGAFIGSDTMLVAPIEIGEGAKTGAGAVVTHDVPPGRVAYGVPARVKPIPDAAEPEVD
jgi:bifunctional UDP-N-acetylglucosamine pyrophosphorylase/glucosamine-1-phosphate N-acetyltransferase